MVDEGDNRPTIQVTQVQLVNGEESPVAVWQKPVLADELIDPGESVQESRVFLVPPVDSASLGWDILFSYELRRRWPFRKDWTFSATTFVSVPEEWRSGV